ncbi:hypothetical protein LCGC14_1864190 [marine sediment metagenome]|uniref:Metal-dependent hydrolase n=1 Tax=marine sediment metagenome TaxID=412755 RepID=A0A0F9G6X7_9ZZZZ
MLPHSHFIISASAAVPVAMLSARTDASVSVAGWAITAGLVSAALDVDVIALVMFKAKSEPDLREYRNPLRIVTRFKGFMSALYKTGLIRTVMATHCLLWAITVAAAYVFAAEMFLPILIGVVTHALSDLPHIWRVALKR